MGRLPVASPHRLSDWFRRWGAPLQRFLRARPGISAADAEDMSQEVFLRLMRYDTAELVDQPQAYLYKVASNVAVEWAIRARNRQPHEPEWLSQLVDERQPEGALFLTQLQNEVERGLRTLSARQRAVLELYFAESLSYAQIAARRGESLRTVRRHFIKSYEKLRLVLDPQLLRGMSHGDE